MPNYSLPFSNIEYKVSVTWSSADEIYDSKNTLELILLMERASFFSDCSCFYIIVLSSVLAIGNWQFGIYIVLLLGFLKYWLGLCFRMGYIGGEGAVRVLQYLYILSKKSLETDMST